MIFSKKEFLVNSYEISVINFNFEVFEVKKIKNYAFAEVFPLSILR